MDQETVFKKNYSVTMKSIRRINYNSGKIYAKGAIVPIEEKIVQLNLSKTKYGSPVYDQLVMGVGEEVQLIGKNTILNFRDAFSPGEVIGSFFMNFRQNDVTNLASMRTDIQKSLIYNKSSYDGSVIVRQYGTASPRDGFFEIKYQVNVNELTTKVPNTK